MIRTQIYIPEDLEKEARLVAGSLKMNFSELVRTSLKEKIARKRKTDSKKRHPLWNLVGIIQGGEKHVSDKIDEILYE
jgi:hypothetical protein